MDQKPIFDKTFVTGIVNEGNYSPVNQGEVEEALEDELEQEFKGHECKEECRCCMDKTEEVSFGPCDEFKEFVVHNVHLHCEGRILKVKVQLKDICRGRRIRLAVLLFEKECHDQELRGLRTCEFMVPGQPFGCLNELTVGDFCFIIPEENICCHKEVKVKVIAHYSSFQKEHMPEY